MSMSWNVFSRLTETRLHPFGKIYSNGLLDGISDTFHIMMGNHGILNLMNGYDDNNKHYGVADILLFPLIAKVMIDYGFPHKPSSTGGAGRLYRDEDKTCFLDIL